MKFIPSVPLVLETMLGTQLRLSLTLILLEEAAQIIVCDQRQQLSNLVCAMNLSASGVSLKILQS